MSLVFNLTKGLLYGIALGILFGLSIFLIGTVAAGLGFITMSPTLLAGLVFANGILGGVAMEYGRWLKAQHNGGLIFALTNGFLSGVVLGIYFGLAVFLMAGAIFALGWLILTPVQMASLSFAVCILMFITYEYSNWLDSQNAIQMSKSGAPGTPSPPATP
ncbi:MAG: hypothetical protein ABSD73_08155 [Candidatus Bathyarchaeia archaeon]|jgi:hypothetical protein